MQKIFIIIQIKGRFNSASDRLPFILKSYLKNTKFQCLFHTVDLTSKIHFIFQFLKIIFFSLYYLFANKKIFCIYPRTNSRLFNLSFCVLNFPFYTVSDGIGDSVYEYKRADSKKYLGHFSSRLLYKNTLYNIPLRFYCEKWKSFLKYNKNGYILIILKKPNLKGESYKNVAKYYQELIFSSNQTDKFFVCGDIKIFRLLNFHNRTIKYIPSFHLLDKKFLISKAYSYPSTALFTLLFIFKNTSYIHILDRNVKKYNLMSIKTMKKNFLNIAACVKF